MTFFVNILWFLEYSMNAIIANINTRISISVNLKAWYTQEHATISRFIADIKSAVPNVWVVYISSQDALEIVKLRDPDLAWIIQDESDNPLPSSLRLENIGLPYYWSLDSIIRLYKDYIEYDESKMQAQLVDYTSQYTKISSLVAFIQTVQFWVYWIVWLFLFTVFMIIYNTIWNFIFFYRDEIKIIELVWGSSSFIYGPFSLQWGIYTLIGTTIGIFLCYTLFSYGNFSSLISFPELPLFFHSFLVSMRQTFFIEIFWFFILGMLSGLLVSKRYMVTAHVLNDK